MQAEEQFRDQEAMYKLLFQNSGEAVLLTDPTGAIISANPAACAMFSMSEEEIQSGGRAGITDGTDPRRLFRRLIFLGLLCTKARSHTQWSGDLSHWC